MIHVCLELCPPGVEGALTDLATYQTAVDSCASYAERVDAAAVQWKRRANTRAIKLVREILLAMCSGLERCMYCEDSLAIDVEHRLPKALYPSLVFAWANFLYACARCNRAKGAKCKVHLPGVVVVDVSRKSSRVPLPVQLAADDPLLLGEPLLIDPRSEDPLQLLHLDLETGAFSEVHAAGLDHERASHTIELLDLNDDGLARARRRTYHADESLLRDYARLKREDNAPEATEPKRLAIVSHSHRTVWEEMKRQRQRSTKLRALFEAAPEALAW